MCFSDDGYVDGVYQKDWKKIAMVVLGEDNSIPLKKMLLKAKQEHQIY